MSSVHFFSDPPEGGQVEKTNLLKGSLWVKKITGSENFAALASRKLK